MSQPFSPAQSRRFPRSFRAVIKPTGSLCNLDCRYCYYLHKKDLLRGTTGHRIADDLLEEFIRQYLAEQDVEEVVFTWHGGEPALLGLDFYRKVVELQQKYGGGKRIKNDLQTNGVLLDDAWCEFLKEHEFLVGLSVDGPKELHDCFRRSARGGGAEENGAEGNGMNSVLRGEGSFDRVYAAAKRLREHGVPFNAVTVIHGVNVRHPEEVYRFLTEELGCWRVQWLPCAELKDFRTVAPGRWDTAQMPVLGSRAAKPGNPESVVTDWSVDPDEWGEFLCRTFDLWMKEGLGKVFVNWFESLVGQWMGLPAQICSLGEVCGRSLAGDGERRQPVLVRPVRVPRVPLGQPPRGGCRLGEVVYSAKQRSSAAASETRCRTTAAVPYEKASPATGSAPRAGSLKTPDGQPGLNYFCSGIQRSLDVCGSLSPRDRREGAAEA